MNVDDGGGRASGAKGIAGIPEEALGVLKSAAGTGSAQGEEAGTNVFTNG